ncbi:AraC family transcriptional regulator [Lysobacter sp. CFH 32150]|uniref:AraC family transcriptional regulator n=1 Tax=Lysobacter sp. CFH 32150 TaxID=2927128 RepID=UPI001FA713C5|nr:AraC family transcriptional regulator [Lysobacter sp. CFH 32150]MCI4569201.1 AraC family transcriptional regulator [Lysobacter sp. CFH 32150]
MPAALDPLPFRDAFLAQLADPLAIATLFDHLPDLVFSVKDREGRYVLMSEACVVRCGLKSKRDAIGKTAYDLFPAPMAQRYARQDERLFRTGKPIVDNLDLTVYRDGSAGWCLSTKEPLRDARGRIIGLACISKDLVEPSRAGYIDAGFADTVDYMLEHSAQPLRLDDLARRAGLSQAQFERRMKKIFQLSAGQYLIKTRIDQAARLLADSELPIAEVALQAGFADQSVLSRQFRQVTGFAPREYRQLMRAAK